MSFLANMAYWQLTPFFPKFLREHSINSTYLGFTMSAFAVAFILSSVITGKIILMRFQRLTCCYIGALFIIVNLFGLASLNVVETKKQIIYLAFVFQIAGGIGNGINTPSSLALLSSYKHDRQAYIGYFELFGGLGGLVGPLVGAAFYYFGGYSAPFFGIGLIYLLIILIFYSL